MSTHKKAWLCLNDFSKNLAERNTLAYTHQKESSSKEQFKSNYPSPTKDTYALSMNDPSSFFLFNLYIQVCVCASVWGPEDNLGYPQDCCLPPLKQGFSLAWCSQICLDQMANEPYNSACLHFLELVFQVSSATTLTFY